MFPYQKSLREATAAAAAPPPSDWAPFGGADDFGKNMGIALAALICSLALAFTAGALVRHLLIRLRRQQPLDSAATAEDPEKPAASEPKLAPAEALPVLVFSAEEGLPDASGGGASAECAICLLEFADGESLRLLPNCGHGFHVGCIDLWIASRRSCPTCRKSWMPLPPTPLPENFGRAGV